jgi:hypothetical protein
MRWGVEKRLEFIEFRLLWEGGINRADIMREFGVSVPQASKDLSLYEERAPGNLVYDRSEKRYFPSPSFKPTFLKPEADRYLLQLQSVSDHIVEPEETWLSHLPPLDAMPVPHRRVEANVLRGLLSAIRRGRAMELLYQSMNVSRPEPTWRWITPHAFSNDGLRWHVRAYCHIDKKFKDFLLSRCLDIGGDQEAGATPADDIFWNEFFEVVLRPNPKLGKLQQEVVARDYGMKDARLRVPVRKALLYYFEKRLRLDVADALDGPHETPIMIANRDAFGAALIEATA